MSDFEELECQIHSIFHPEPVVGNEGFEFHEMPPHPWPSPLSLADLPKIMWFPNAKSLSSAQAESTSYSAQLRRVFGTDRYRP